jgi:hypothetical protein
MVKPNETIYAGDAQFVGWSDSHTGGPIIKLRLPSSDDLDKFRTLTVGKGAQAGHLFTVAIVEHDGEGNMLPPPEPSKASDPPAARPKSGPYCIEAIDLCRNPMFQKWLEGEAGVPVRSEQEAKKGLLAILGISSRKDIDGDLEVVNAFVDNVRVPFMQWMRETRGETE